MKAAMSKKANIPDLVSDLLRKHKVLAPPVPLERLVKAHKIQVVMKYLDDDVSGFIANMDGTPVIGVNSFHPLVRQRFTIAHELGHFLLHKPSGVHIDDNDFFIKFRDDNARDGTDKDEREANLFAASLLMPKDFLVRDFVRMRNLAMHDDSAALALAKKYGVSVQALLIRLASLKLLSLA